MIDKFRLVKAYPGSPSEGVVVIPTLTDRDIFQDQARTFTIHREVLESYPDFWQPNEKLLGMEMRFKTTKGNKIYSAKETIELKNGYRFVFANGMNVDIVVDDFETDFNFCEDA